MKKIVIAGVLIAISLVGYSQSNVDLRGDSTRIYKSGGFNELVVRNRTKDSTGILMNLGNGITQWKRSRAISPTQFTVGSDTITFAGGGGGGSQTWDQTLNVGATNLGKTLVFDTALTVADGGSNSHINMNWKPIRQGDGTPDFNWNLGAQRYSGVSQADNIMNFGWNINGGGGVNVVGQPGIGLQFEQRYIPVAGDTNTEFHGFYLDAAAGIQHRIFSYTIKEYLGSISYYQTVGTFDLRRYDNDSIWYALQYNSQSFSYLGDRMDFQGDLNGWSIGKVGFHAYDNSYYGDRFLISNFSVLKAPGQLDLGGGAGSHNVDAAINFEDSLENQLAYINASATDMVIASQNGTTNPIKIKPGNIQNLDLYTDHANFVVPVLLFSSNTTPIARIDIRENTGLETAIYADQNSSGLGNSWGAEITSRGGNSNNIGMYLDAHGGSSSNKGLNVNLPSDGVANWSIYNTANAPFYQAGWMKITSTDGSDRPKEAMDIGGFMKLDSLKTSTTTDGIFGWNSTTHAASNISRLIGTATLNFGSTAAGASTDLTVTVTGAVDGDQVYIGVPNGSTLSNGFFTAWVSANDTVTIRFTNPQSVGALDPASGTFTAQIIK